MATEAQTAANRRNAARSTGPRTQEGKEASSRNSLKHGLTKPPPYSDVMDWYRLITGSDSPPGLQPSRVEAAALALAEAEAHLQRAMRAEEHFQKDLGRGESLAPHLRQFREKITEFYNYIPGVSPEVERKRLARSRKVPYKMTRRVFERWTNPHKHLERLGRYRRAAEVRRHEALRGWMDVLLDSDFKTKPNTSMGSVT
jgi:hypothetical protein